MNIHHEECARDKPDDRTTTCRCAVRCQSLTDGMHKERLSAKQTFLFYDSLRGRLIKRRLIRSFKCEIRLPRESRGQPIPEDAYLTVGITALQEHLTSRFGGVLPEEEYVEWRNPHGI